MTHPNRPLIESAIMKGEKYLWIANEYDVSQTTIKRYKVRMGIELKKRKLSEDDYREIRKLKGKLSNAKIGKQFGVSNVMVGRILKR